MDARWRVRQVVNVVNLSTPLGLLVALAGRARLSRGPDGLLLARRFRLGVPAPAFTVGNVVLIRLDDEALTRRPGLLRHEARHATQYACCIGPVMLPLYGLAAPGRGCAAATPRRTTCSRCGPGCPTAAIADRRRPAGSDRVA